MIMLESALTVLASLTISGASVDLQPAKPPPPRHIPPHAIGMQVPTGGPRSVPPPGPRPSPAQQIGGSDAGAACLNPQPLPPRPNDRVNAACLNPQPLPPRPGESLAPAATDRATAAGLNPQPLPYREPTRPQL